MNDSESVAQEAESLYVGISGKESGDYLPELSLAEAPIRPQITQGKTPSLKYLKRPDGPTEKEALVKARRVQSFFRAAVLNSYDYRCALTGLAIPELLTASHIIPWNIDEKRRADPRNGICLNALHDRAFDRGLITFDKDLRVVVSIEITKSEDSPIQREQLIGIAGHPLRLPTRFQLDASAIEYHRQHIFRR